MLRRKESSIEKDVATMTIKVQWIFNGTMVLLTLLTLPLLGMRNIKRFLPASILIGLVEMITLQIGKKRKWWVFYNKPNSYLFNEFPYNISVFFVVSMWVMKWTYGNFIRFLFLNGIINSFFAFPFSKFARKIRYYTLVRISHFQFFLYFFSKAILFYCLQLLFENKNTTRENILKLLGFSSSI